MFMLNTVKTDATYYDMSRFKKYILNSCTLDTT